MQLPSTSHHIFHGVIWRLEINTAASLTCDMNTYIKIYRCVYMQPHEAACERVCLVLDLLCTSVQKDSNWENGFTSMQGVQHLVQEREKERGHGRAKGMEECRWMHCWQVLITSVRFVWFPLTSTFFDWSSGWLHFWVKDKMRQDDKRLCTIKWQKAILQYLKHAVRQFQQLNKVHRRCYLQQVHATYFHIPFLKFRVK